MAAGTNCDLFTHKLSRSYLNHLVYGWIPFKMRSVSDKTCVKNQTGVYSINLPLIVPLMKQMWKNMVQPERPQMAI
jgi:hypothetical protein